MTREGLNVLAQYDEQELQAAELGDYATKEDIAHILARINAITTSPAMAETPLAQMATLLARTALADTPHSDGSAFRLHGALSVGAVAGVSSAPGSQAQAVAGAV